ncbi:MAG: amino acid ABC transporter permease [Proteobacteria bacterium]|nr:MAG: amino acid ABC transporter permease [Pseudomonadota bacterium]
MAVYEEKQARQAPKGGSGVLGWLRQNLFSSPLNIFLTILGIWILYLIIPPFIQWSFIDANFSGTTREQCTGSGACWIFVKEKLDMFMYGFYPEHERWRINLMGILFIIIVFGSKFIKNNFAKFAILSAYFILVAIFTIGGIFGLEYVPTDKWGGLMLSILVAATGIIFSFPIGIIVAFGRQSKLPIIKSVCVTYVEFIRGVPLITILFMSSIILPLFFPEGITFDKLLRAVIGITLFQAAYTAEVIRGGLQSIPKGQYEAADAVGLSYWQKMILVILPQALKVAIPNLVGIFISLFQDTTLVLIVGLFDLLGMVRITSADKNWLGMETEGYVFVALVFWLFCYLMSRYSKILEDKFNTDIK